MVNIITIFIGLKFSSISLEDSIGILFPIFIVYINCDEKINDCRNVYYIYPIITKIDIIYYAKIANT